MRKFEAIMRKSNSGEERKLAVGFLEFARQRRELWGWDVSTWALVIDPTVLKKLGFDISFPT